LSAEHVAVDGRQFMTDGRDYSIIYNAAFAFDWQLDDDRNPASK